MSHSTATQLVRNANRSTFSAVTRGFASTMASVVFIGAILLYVASFLQVRLASFGVDSATGLPMTRAEFLVLLMQSPGFLLQQWTGGAWSRVGVLDRLPVLAGAALWLVACWAPGRCLLRAIQVDRKMSTCELGVYSFAVGLSVLSLSTLAIGLCGDLHVPALIVVAPVACWAFEIVWRLRQRRANCNTRPTRSSTSTMPSRPMRWQWAVCAPFALLLVLSALLPPWAFDARCYHLQAPKEFAASGFIGFVPHNVYANMPLGAEMHALAAMVLWPGADGWWFGTLVGKVVIAACTILTSVGLYASASRFASPRAGAIAAVTYISIPWILYVSTTGLIDGVVAMYFALALLAALRWATAAGDTSLSWPALSGVLAGSAVACKYPAVLFVAVPLLLFVCAIAFHRTRRQTSRGTLRETARAGLVFVVAATASCGLWLAKNAVLTGNPTYPLLYDVFGGETRTEAKEDQWSRVHSPPRDDFGRTHSIGQAVESAVRVLWSSNWLSPLVWPLCAAGLWLARDRRMAWGLGASIVAYFALWWLLTHRIDRFWLPVLPAAPYSRALALHRFALPRFAFACRPCFCSDSSPICSPSPHALSETIDYWWRTNN